MIPITVTYAALAATFLAVAGIAAGLLSIVFAPRREAGLDLFEKSRRSRLREASTTYRWFEPLIDELAPILESLSPGTVAHFNAQMRFLRDKPPWKAGEFLGTCVLEGAAMGAVAFPIILLVFGPVAAVLVGIGMIPLWQYLCDGEYSTAARKWTSAVKLRLPFALDLLSMMMAAGLEFQTALKSLVQSLGNHPLGAELAELLRKLDIGILPREAFQQLGNTYEDGDIREFTSAVIQGLDLGTPLKSIFRIQSDQMRLKRSQWIEKAAAQAEVKMTGPGLLVALVCMAVLLAPFVLLAMNMY